MFLILNINYIVKLTKTLQTIFLFTPRSNKRHGTKQFSRNLITFAVVQAVISSELYRIVARKVSHSQWLGKIRNLITAVHCTVIGLPTLFKIRTERVSNSNTVVYEYLTTGTRKQIKSQNSNFPQTFFSILFLFLSFLWQCYLSHIGDIIVR